MAFEFKGTQPHPRKLRVKRPVALLTSKPNRLLEQEVLQRLKAHLELPLLFFEMRALRGGLAHVCCSGAL